MKKADVEAGGTYAVKVSGRVVAVEITRIYHSSYGGPGRSYTRFTGRNLSTEREITFLSAARLRNRIHKCPNCEHWYGTSFCRSCAKERAPIEE